MLEQTIGDRYTLQARIGAGGMGTVYQGLDLHAGNTVAVKQLKSEIATDDQIERFRREGEALRELNHPNIVKMLDTVKQDGQHYLVMEHVSGGDLRGLIDKEGRLDYHHAVDMAIDLADALTRAHRLDIIHRDLKPGNVLIAEDGSLRLTDFGVAHVAHQHRVTATDSTIGTILYMSPEAFDGQIAAPGMDIWAFGVMLAEMLSGQHPFAQDTLSNTVNAILFEPMPDLEKTCPDVPAALLDLIYRMLERDARTRIPSVRIVAAELEAILHGRDAPQSSRLETPVTDKIAERRHNLPVPPTPFVGRTHELDDIARLISDPNIRLFTILAPGGMGKTRLSLEAARAAVDQFEHSVYFVELAPLSDPANIVSAIADATGYPFQGGQDQQTQIERFLSNKTLLLVMDNFEHLLDGAGIVSDMLRAAPDVKILATSRTRLNQPGETLFHLGGMDFPDWETPDDALEYAAVKLFMHSAKRARPDFELAEDNLDSVARMCRLVQGMPLGIVLAASWLAILTPEEIAAEIAAGIDFLATDERDLPERQRSIRAVMDYSWHEMTDAEQAVFAKLSVFRGGFTREAAQAITGATLRVLLSLVNKSLLRRDPDTGRYAIHELLRQYAEEQLLGAAGDTDVYENHSRYYLDRTTALFDELCDARQINAMHEFELEIENIMRAWRWAVAQSQFSWLSRASYTIWLMLIRHKPVGAYFDLLDSAYAAMDGRTDIDLIDSVRLRLTWHSYNINRPYTLDAGQIADELSSALADARQLHADFEIWMALQQLARLALDNDRYAEAYELFEQAIQHAQEAEDYWAVGMSAFLKGYVSNLAGKEAFFVPLTELAYQMADRVGDLFNIGKAANNLMVAALHDRDFDEALRYHTEQLGIMRQMASWQYGNALVTYGIMLIELGRFEEASDQLDEAMIQAERYNAPYVRQAAMRARASMDYYEGKLEKAREGSAEALKIAQDHKLAYAVASAHQDLALILHWMGHFEDAHHHIRQSAKNFYSTPLNNAYFLQMILPLLRHQNEREKTVAYLSVLLNDPKQIPIILKDPHLLSLKAQLESDLGAETFAAAWERGKSLDADAVVQSLLAEFTQDSDLP